MPRRAASSTTTESSSSEVRRSSRARKESQSYYDEDAKRLEKDKRRKANATQDEETDVEMESEEEVSKAHDAKSGNQSESDDDDDESVISGIAGRPDSDSEEENDGDFNPKSPKKKIKAPPKKPTAVRKPKADAGSKKTKKLVQTRLTSAGKAKKPSSTRAPGRAGVQKALEEIKKTALHPSETPDNSLVAALLNSCKSEEGKKSKSAKTVSDISGNVAAKPTLYTVKLEAIAKKVAKELANDPNSGEVSLINLIFRTVGGTVETNLDALEIVLSEMPDDELSMAITNVVQSMMDNGYDDNTLFYADPNEPSKSSRQVSVAVQAYREIFREFWYRLGRVILSGMTTSPKSSATEDDGEDDGADKTVATDQTFLRAEINTLRNIINHISGITSAGQPDFRAASTIAVLEICNACLEHSADILVKLEVAKRQQSAAKKSSSQVKTKAIEKQIKTYEHIQTDLEEVIDKDIFKNVFIHRFRDTNEHVRQICIESLSTMCLKRPDLFLVNARLKFMGWMLFDKSPNVREASLAGFLRPFEIAERDAKKKSKDKRPKSLVVDLEKMSDVCGKFLKRISDSVNDAHSVVAQEMAMSLMLHMLHKGLLENWEDEEGWDQVNLKVLDKTTSPKVRRDALYFVFDQLDSFESTGDEKLSSKGLSQKLVAERLSDVANWVANTLCDNDVHIDKIKFEYADLVVQALRDMPEHKNLITDWSALLQAVQGEDLHDSGSSGREIIAKQRVLLRMLACSVDLDFGTPKKDDSKGAPTTNKRKRGANDPQDLLSTALLSSLSPLLVAFNGDTIALRTLAKLPQYLQPTVFSLPVRKKDFVALVKNLSQLFLESTDEEVLKRVAFSLSVMAEGDHARVSEVKLHLKRLATSLQERTSNLLHAEDDESQSKEASRKSSKSSRASRRSGRSAGSASTRSSDASDTMSSDAFDEYSVSLSLMRWRILIKRCDVHDLFDDGIEEEFHEEIGEALAQRLEERVVIEDEEDDEDDENERGGTIPEIWTEGSAALHSNVRKSIDEGLSFLLIALAWKVREALEPDQEKAGGEDSTSSAPEKCAPILKMRERLVRLIGMSFDQYLNMDSDLAFSEAHKEFSVAVQTSACRTTSDLQTLLPKEWSKSPNPVRSSLAFTDDVRLIGGMCRFVLSRKDAICASAEDPARNAAIVNESLLPIARGLAANWVDGNRREASIALSHMSSEYGKEPAHVAQALIRVMKKIDPIRMLEAQLASLRNNYEAWLSNDPTGVDSEDPTSTQERDLENANALHEQAFDSMLQYAAKLSQSLGVGKLPTPLADGLLGFVQEGLRYAFHENSAKDSYILGVRLPFLTILCKFASWIKKNKRQTATIEKYLADNERRLREHPGFDEVHPDDLSAIDNFRKTYGIRAPQFSTSASMRSGGSTLGSRLNASSYTDDDQSRISMASLSVARSSRGSHRPRGSLSVASNLSTLREDALTAGDSGDESDEDDGPSPAKKRKSSRSMGSSVTMSTAGRRSALQEDDESE